MEQDIVTVSGMQNRQSSEVNSIQQAGSLDIVVVKLNTSRRAKHFTMSGKPVCNLYPFPIACDMLWCAFPFTNPEYH